MDHQDFKVVNVGNRDVARQRQMRQNREVVKRKAACAPKDADPETAPIKMVTGDLKRKIAELRLSYTEPGNSRPGITQDRLALLAKVKAQDIRLLEQGRMDLKQAKQIALSIERHLRVKIL